MQTVSCMIKMNSDVTNIYKKICGMICEFIKFDESKNLLKNFFPTKDLDEIKKRQNYLKEMFKKLGNIKVGEINPIKIEFKRLNDRILIVDEDEYNKAVELNVCDVETEPIKGYPLTLSTQGFGIDVREISLFEIAPDVVIKTLYDNKDVLIEISRVISKLNGQSVATKILAELGRIDDVYKKYDLINSIDEIVHSKLREIRKSIEEKVSKEKIVLSGTEILEYLSSKKSSKFSKFEEYAIEEILKAERELSKKFGIKVEVFSKKMFPEINYKEVEKLRMEFERELIVEKFLKSREIVRNIKPLLKELERELKLVYEIEFVRGLKEFFNRQPYCFPEFNGKISFESAYNLFIKNPQPISYYINREIVVLTGANSGGKTSLLELITQIQLLSQMGLPVPAKVACVDTFDEIFLFKRKRSTYNAGAFESTLKSFTSALVGDTKKLILIDEFEAITEPGAAAKIVSEFLKIGYEKGFYMIVVSHMGAELKSSLDFIRVDGIEAKGLDENLNLVVDRQPKIGVLGKSTPELVVERLFKLSKGKRKEILKRILNVFDHSN